MTPVCHNNKCVQCAFDSDCCGDEVCSCNECVVPELMCTVPPTPDPPVFEAIPVDVYDLSPGFGLVPGNSPTNPPSGWFPNTEVPRHILVFPTCTFPTPRSPGPDNLTVTVAGEVNLDLASPVNDHPLGGYIMTSEHSGMDHTLPMDHIIYSTALTQAEVDAGDALTFFPSFDQVGDDPHEIQVFAVSEWYDLNAQCVVNGDVATITWDPSLIPASCPDEDIEVVVSIRDETQMCDGLGGTAFTFLHNDGLLTTSATNMVDIQLTSGTPSPAHNIVQCSAYGYLLSSKSAAAIIPVVNALGV